MHLSLPHFGTGSQCMWEDTAHTASCEPRFSCTLLQQMTSSRSMGHTAQFSPWASSLMVFDNSISCFEGVLPLYLLWVGYDLSVMYLVRLEFCRLRLVGSKA